MQLTNTDCANIALLLSAAEQAFAAGNYAPPQEVTTTYSLVETIYGDGNSMFGWVLAVNNLTVAVIRGTERPIEWMQDAEFTLDNTPYGQVEHGFNLVANSLVVGTVPLVNYLSSSVRGDLIVTGHSLGAAAATIVCAQIAETRPVTLVAMASPKVGDFQFVSHISGLPNLSHYIFSNIKDIVPMLPPFDVYVSMPDIIMLDPAKLNELTPPRYLNDDAVSDHLVENYIGMLDITVFDAYNLGYGYNPTLISTKAPSGVAAELGSVLTAGARDLTKL